MYDRTFDKGYIGINEKCEVLVSSALQKNSYEDYYLKYFSHLTGTKLSLPGKYPPKKAFLQYHLDSIFRGLDWVTPLNIRKLMIVDEADHASINTNKDGAVVSICKHPLECYH